MQQRGLVKGEDHLSLDSPEDLRWGVKGNWFTWQVIQTTQVKGEGGTWEREGRQPTQGVSKQANMWAPGAQSYKDLWETHMHIQIRMDNTHL